MRDLLMMPEQVVEARGEPVMQWCPWCERATEADDIVRLPIPGGDGETNDVCRECADARGYLR